MTRVREHSLTTASLPSAENKRHYPSLDGLRAVAVLIVFAQHYFVYPESFHWGWTGVQVFFVLSGFLITGILYDTRNAAGRYKVFYARRALRIFPLYFAVLIAGWALWPVFRWDLHPAWSLAPVYLTNYSRFLWLHDFHTNPAVEHLQSTLNHGHALRLLYGHFWSLSVEEQFYFVWPFVVFTVRDRRKLLRICLAVVCIVPLLRLACTLMLPMELLKPGFVSRVTPLQCDSLLLGAALALWLRGERTQDDHRRMTSLARWVVTAAAVVFLLFEAGWWAVHHAGYATDVAYPVFGSIGLTAINLCSAALLLLAIDASTAWSRFLNLRWLQWLGKVSYGFYVLHDIPHVIYYQIVVSSLGARSDPYGIYTGILGFVCTLLLAAMSFNLFETPFLRLKSRFEISREI